MIRIGVLAIGILLGTVALPAERVRFDFETGDLQGWQVMEGRFGALVTDRALCRNTPDTPYPKEGRWFLSTTELADGGFDDGMTGVVESPVVRLTGPRISLMVGGGGHPDTYVGLCTEDGTEIRRAQGTMSETMHRVEWSVPELVGKNVFLVVVDGNKGSWGHVTLDAVEAEGVVDWDATARVRAAYEKRKEARMRKQQQQEAQRARWRENHRKQLQDRAYLMGRGARQTYTGDRLTAISMPVGGIGAGCIQMDGYGRPAIWQIFGNYKALAIPDSFFAMRCRAGSNAPVVRLLHGGDGGAVSGMRTVRFQGEYPYGWWTMTDPAVPVEVRLEVYAPLVPGNVRDSGMPCAVSNLTVLNRGKEPVSIDLLAVQQNAVGIDPNRPPDGRRSEAYGGNVNRIVRERGLTLITMERPSKPASGTMALGTPAAGVKAIADCGNVADLLARFAQDGKIASQAAQNVETTPPSLDGTTYDGALALGMRLKPGEARTTTFFLTWHFPGVKHGGDIEGWTSDGNMYENWWTSAADVARELKRRLPELARTTRAYHDTLYQSNLPVWLLDRISSQVAVLRSMTCFWGRDGYFGAWEGCGGEKGCCAGNCSHVWHYAQAHARLWPELGRIMRQEELSHSTPEGAVPHRQPNAPPAFDGQCGTILESYREHLSSPDDGWLKVHWPKIRGALDYVIKRWDADEDGLLTGPQWNTLDENLGGNSSWLGSLYIASLKAGAKMAQRMGDAGATDRYERIARRASEHQDALLFNGEYYIQVPDLIPYRDYGPGCHIDQVLGQWWADMLDLGQVYPEEHMRSALTSVHRYNFHYDFVGMTQAPRKFVHDDDAGTQMITWPRGGRPDPEHQMLYADEVMTGFEYAAAANMIARGLLEEGLRTVRAVADRYDGRLRTGLTPGDSASWGYSGNPFGDDECGKFYARSMSSWSLLLACQGFVYDGPARVIGFLPRWQPDDHASFFTAAEGWGLFTQKRTRGVMRAALEVRHGKVPMTTFVLQHTGVKTPQARLTLAGKPVKCSVEIAGDALSLKFSRSLTLKTGDRLEAVIK